jgi:hypothetical protein
MQWEWNNAKAIYIRRDLFTLFFIWGMISLFTHWRPYSAHVAPLEA